MRSTWPEIRGLTVKVQVLLLVSRRPTVKPQATSLSSKRQQHLLPQLMDQMMRLVAIKIPHIMRILTPKRLSLLTRKMRDCTSLVTSRKLYPMILFCKLELQNANFQLCKMLFVASYNYFRRVRSVCWFGGIVVRGCTSRSLLGSYVHQELLLIM